MAVDYDCDGDITIETSADVEGLRRSCTELGGGTVTFNITESDASLVFDWEHAGAVVIDGRALTAILGASDTTTLHMSSLFVGSGVTKLQLRDSVEAVTISSLTFLGNGEGEERACTAVIDEFKFSGMGLDEVSCSAEPDIVVEWGSDLEPASDNVGGGSDVDDDDNDDNEDTNDEDSGEGTDDAEEEDDENGAVTLGTVRVGVAVGAAVLTFLALMG